MSKIAVLLASYNGQKYIGEQIQSIRNQEDVVADIFLRDDKSTDDTVNVALKQLPSDRVIINTKGTGSAANNFFLSILEFKDAEKYDYFAFSDQDDIWLPQKLKKAVDRLKEEHAVLYTSNLLVWDTKTNSKKLLRKDYSQKKFDFLFEGGSAGCTYVFSRDFFYQLQNKLKTTDYLNWPDFSHDWFTYFLARISKKKVINSPDAEILYRIHECNVYGQLNSVTFNSVRKRIKMVREGWYLNNSLNYAKTLSRDSEEFQIYKLYCENFMTRTRLFITYNFSLIRNPLKFMVFCFLSLVCTGYPDKKTFDAVFKSKK